MLSRLWFILRRWFLTDTLITEACRNHPFIPEGFMTLYYNELRVYHHYKITDYNPIIMVVLSDLDSETFWIKKWINSRTIMIEKNKMMYVCKLHEFHVKEGVLYVKGMEKCD